MTRVFGPFRILVLLTSFTACLTLVAGFPATAEELELVASGGEAGDTAAGITEAGDGELEASRIEGEGQRCRPVWQRPVASEVADPFRPPSHRFGPGNRGLEYATDLGDRVEAVAAGVVRFAGQVGGAPVVVIDHGGDLWSTYVALTERHVTRGEPIERSQVIGLADVGFHLTARHQGNYLDPELFISQRCVMVRLVPIPDWAAQTPGID